MDGRKSLFAEVSLNTSLSLLSYMSSNYPYGLDPNYGASYLPPVQQAVPPGIIADDGKGKEDSAGKGKDPVSPVDSAKVREHLNRNIPLINY